jgi:hypothetical protein
MANQMVGELRAKTDAAFGNLSRQLRGMEPHMDRADAPGQWTTRQVLSHLLFETGWKPVDTLKTFAHSNLPVIEITPGVVDTSGERATMPLGRFVEAPDPQPASFHAAPSGSKRRVISVVSHPIAAARGPHS